MILYIYIFGQMDLGSAGISKDLQETVGYSLNTEYKLLAKMSLLFLASNTPLVLGKMGTVYERTIHKHL